MLKGSPTVPGVAKIIYASTKSRRGLSAPTRTCQVSKKQLILDMRHVSIHKRNVIKRGIPLKVTI
eukprot:11094243-Ditylum_brightwellii.AAC.1